MDKNANIQLCRWRVTKTAMVLRIEDRKQTDGFASYKQFITQKNNEF